MKDIIPNF